MERKEARTPQPRVSKAAFVDDPTTSLDSIIIGEPWLPQYSYGRGIDVVTGKMKPSAIVPFSYSSVIEKTQRTNFTRVQTQQDFDQQVAFNVGGMYNTGIVSVSGSASFLKHIKYSATSFTLLARYETEATGYEEGKNFQLTEEAKQKVSDPNSFRQAYGDYFISGSLKGSRFLGLYVCTTESDLSLNSFSATLAYNAPNLLTAEGSATFSQLASAYSVSVTCSWTMIGAPEEDSPVTGTSPADVLAALKWFKEHNTDVPLYTQLTHYSTIESKIPHYLSVPSKSFLELTELFHNLWDIRVMYNSIPSHYQAKYQVPFRVLDAGVTASQGILITDNATRTNYLTTSQELKQDLSNVLIRQAFYQLVLDKRSGEPKTGKWIEAGYTPSWLYGFSDYYDPAIQITKVTKNYSSSHGAGHQYSTLSVSSTALIVGWQVISNWTDDTNGYWQKKTSGIILGGTTATVYVQSYLSRGCSWTLNVYTVPAEDYQFSGSTTATRAIKSDIKASEKKTKTSDKKPSESEEDSTFIQQKSQDEQQTSLKWVWDPKDSRPQRPLPEDFRVWGKGVRARL